MRQEGVVASAMAAGFNVTGIYREKASGGGPTVNELLRYELCRAWNLAER